MITELTYKIAAFSVDPGFNSDECVNWAMEILEMGHETEGLLILAGLRKPTNHFETTSYLRRTFQELGLEEKTGQDGICSYCRYYVGKIARGEDVKQSLESIRLFCQIKDYEKSIYDFYLLSLAWDDLGHGNGSNHWPVADSNNIESIVSEKAKDWLLANEKHYAQKINL